MSGLDLCASADIFLLARGSRGTIEDREVRNPRYIGSRDRHDSSEASCVEVVKLGKMISTQCESVSAVYESAGDLYFVDLEPPNDVKFMVVPDVFALVEFPGCNA